MKRRQFVQLSSSALFSALLGCGNTKEKLPFTIEVQSDHKVGHLVLESILFPKVKEPKVETLIVGGGIAGMTSAFLLKDESFKLFELSNRLGGSAASNTYNETTFAQGAHYDMVYPQKFGKQVLQTLVDLDIVYEDGAFYNFKDEKYIIPKDLMTTCKFGDEYYHEVLFQSEWAHKFYQAIVPYYEKMTLPSRLSDRKTKELDNITFKKWLEDLKIPFPKTFLEGMDYHLIDDYGAGADTVSAFAGIAYYAVRPEIGQCCATFSPPQGNAYFIDKMNSFLPKNTVFKEHLVKKITKKEKGFITEVIDIKDKVIKEIHSDKIIYAGQKHALKYILKEEKQKLDIQQAPWMVMNIILKNENTIPFGSWQNENLEDHSSFMGFVDSSTQYSQKDRVLTVYHCFNVSERESLKKIEGKKQEVVLASLKKIAEFFQIESEEVISQIEKVYINLLGHGMPIPKPGYLFNDLNDNRRYKELVYAGVDNGRLPFLTEAMDSAIEAVSLLKNQ